MQVAPDVLKTIYIVPVVELLRNSIYFQCQYAFRKIKTVMKLENFLQARSDESDFSTVAQGSKIL